MIRRRRPRERELFSFDSFLDVVANVVGIIIRLILVAWVGARAYRAVIPTIELPPPPAMPASEPLPPLADERLPLLERRREEIGTLAGRVSEQERRAAEVRAGLPPLTAELANLARREKDLEAERSKLTGEGRPSERTRTSPGKAAGEVRAVAMEAEELQKRSRTLLEQIEALRKQPVPKKELRYRTPVSRPLQTDEVMFECRQGKVTLIDTGALLERVKRGLRERGEKLRDRWDLTDTTEPVGAFRLRYVVERERTSLDSPGGAPSDGPYRFGLAGWEVEPITTERGEPGEQALAPGSAFRRIIDALDPQQTAITLWVYPDSFELYRRLRDHLHDREITVAGRPLPEGAPIASSRKGSVSRGQ